MGVLCLPNDRYEDGYLERSSLATGRPVGDEGVIGYGGVGNRECRPCSACRIVIF